MLGGLWWIGNYMAREHILTRHRLLVVLICYHPWHTSYSVCQLHLPRPTVTQFLMWEPWPERHTATTHVVWDSPNSKTSSISNRFENHFFSSGLCRVHFCSTCFCHSIQGRSILWCYFTATSEKLVCGCSGDILAQGTGMRVQCQFAVKAKLSLSHFNENPEIDDTVRHEDVSEIGWLLAGFASGTSRRAKQERQEHKQTSCQRKTSLFKYECKTQWRGNWGIVQH